MSTTPVFPDDFVPYFDTTSELMGWTFTSPPFYGQGASIGQYYLDQNDTSSPTNGVTVLAGPGNKRIKRIRERINVLWFGADPTAVVGSTNAFKAAAAECRRVKATMYIPNGTYEINDTIWLKDNYTEAESVFSIEGESADRTVILWANPNENVPVFAARGKLSGEFGWGSGWIKNLRIKPYNGSFNFKGIGISLQSTNCVLIENVQIWWMKVGIDIINAQKGTWCEFNVIRKTYLNYNNSGIRFDFQNFVAGNDTSFHGNRIESAIINIYGGSSQTERGQIGIDIPAGHAHIYNNHWDVTFFGIGHPNGPMKQDNGRQVPDFNNANAPIAIFNAANPYSLSGSLFVEGIYVKFEAANPNATFKFDGNIHQINDMNQLPGIVLTGPAPNPNWHWRFINQPYLLPNKGTALVPEGMPEATVHHLDSMHGSRYSYNNVQFGVYWMTRPFRENLLVIGYKDPGSGITLGWRDYMDSNVRFKETMNIDSSGSNITSFSQNIRQRYDNGQFIIEKRIVNGSTVTFQELSRVNDLSFITQVKAIIGGNLQVNNLIRMYSTTNDGAVIAMRTGTTEHEYYFNAKRSANIGNYIAFRQGSSAQGGITDVPFILTPQGPALKASNNQWVQMSVQFDGTTYKPVFTPINL